MRNVKAGGFVAGRNHTGLAGLTPQGRAAAELASGRGLHVRHIRSFLAQDDDICFHLFEATSAAAIACVSELAGFDQERVTEVIA